MRSTALAVAMCLAPLAAIAQNSGRLEGPISGVIFHRDSRALRPMIGVPGASYLGPAMAGDLEAAAVSPDGGMALAVSQGRLVLLPALLPSLRAAMPGAAAAGVAVEGAIENVDQIAWSPDGGVAILYASRTHRAQLLRDVQGSAMPGPAIEVTNDVLSIAVSSAGDLLAGMEGGVYLLTQGSVPRSIASAIRPVAMTIRGADLYVADAGADRLWQVRDFAGRAETFVFADGVPSLVGVQVSAGGKLLFAASSSERRLTVFDMATSTAVARVDLDCTPTELRAFGGRDLWLLNSSGGGNPINAPLYVAGGTAEPAAWFVPAGREQ